MAKYCAPNRIDKYNKNKTCFSYKSLKRIAEKLDVPTYGSTRDIQERIQNKFNHICKGNEYCVIDKNNLLDTKEAQNAFKPVHPTSNKYEWLSNFDMNKVMRQYEKKYKNFVFMGSVPIDFDQIYRELRNLDVKYLLKNKTNKMGIIFNLDPSYKGGSHWVSTYMEISNDRCDICFCDSGGDPPVKEIDVFMNRVIASANKLGYTMEKRINQIPMQKQDSECGVYSLYFITEQLKGKSFNRVISKNLTDKKMNKYREHFFNKIKV